MDWFYLALIAPLLWAFVILIDDNLIRGVYKSAYFGTIISGLFGALPLLSLLFVPITLPSPSIILIMTAAGFLNVTYYFLYFKGLQVEVPSVTIALFNLTPALVPFLAYFLLGESLTIGQYVGLGIILLAAVGISAVDIKKFKFSDALFVIAVASLLFAVVSIINKYVYGQVPFWTGYMFFALGMGLAGLFFMTAFKEGRKFPSEIRAKFRKFIGIFVIGELLNIGAEITQNLAISKGPVSLVRVMEGVLPVYLLLLAVLFYRFFPKYLREAVEGNKTKKFFLMGLMLGGLYLINISSRQ